MGKNVTTMPTASVGARAWLYCRAAHPDAVDSLGFQQERLTNFAAEHGFTVVGVSAEYAVGRSLERVGLSETMNAVRDGLTDVVLVVNLSRITRNTMALIKFMDELTEHGVRLIAVNSAASEEHTRSLLQFYRALLSQGVSPTKPLAGSV